MYNVSAAVHEVYVVILPAAYGSFFKHCIYEDTYIHLDIIKIRNNNTIVIINTYYLLFIINNNKL